MMTINSLEQLTKSTKSGVTIVDFYADWCGPCKALAPTLEQLESESKEDVKVVKINVDENPELAQDYEVRGIPTLFFFKEGEVKGSTTGNVSLAELKQRVHELV